MADQIYKVKDPSGAILEIRGPAGASDDEIIAQAQELLGSPADTQNATDIASAKELPSMVKATANAVAPNVSSLLGFGLSEGEGKGLQEAGTAALSEAGKIGNNIFNVATWPTRITADAVTSLASGGRPTKSSLTKWNDEREAILKDFDKSIPVNAKTTIARLLTDIAGTAGVGGGLGALVKSVSQAPKAVAFANALTSSGVGRLAQKAKYIPRVIAGGVTGGASTAMVDPENAGTGAGFGMLLPAVAPLQTAIGHIITNAIGPLRESWRTSQGRKFMTEMLGDDATRQSVIQAIQARKPSEITTVADDIAAANVGRTNKFGSPLVSIEDELATQPGGLSDIAKSIAAKQEAGRRNALAQVIPDIPEAIAAREAASAPLYQQADMAKAVMGPQFQQLFERMPRGTLRKAADIARMEGQPFQIGQYIPSTATTPAQYPKMSGQSLHYIKRALSDIANAPPSAQGAGRDAQAAARGVLDEFVTVFGGDVDKGVRGAIPAYGQARAAYAEGSKPIEQAKVLTAMQDILSGQGGPERITPFMNILGRGEQALLKKSTGFPRYEAGDLPKVLTGKGQMDAVNRVESELTRDLERKSLGQSVDTKHLFEIAEKGKGHISIPTLLSRPAMLANFVMKKIGKGADEIITEDVGRLMLSDPAGFSAKYLQDIPVSQRQKVIDALMRNSLNPAIGVTPPMLYNQSQGE